MERLTASCQLTLSSAGLPFSVVFELAVAFRYAGGMESLNVTCIARPVAE